VPVTSGVSGLVFVLALFSISTPLRELVLFGIWGLVYAVECVVRRARPPVSAVLGDETSGNQ
jgi:hypothetical protein